MAILLGPHIYKGMNYAGSEKERKESHVKEYLLVRRSRLAGSEKVYKTQPKMSLYKR